MARGKEEPCQIMHVVQHVLWQGEELGEILPKNACCTRCFVGPGRKDSRKFGQ